MKKRPFVLLEILIAFTLVSISILPFLHYPFEHMQKEIDTLFEMELERLAQNELVNLQAMLYRKEIPEKILFDSEKEFFRMPGEVRIVLSSGLSRTYPMRRSVSWERQKKVGTTQLVSLLNLRVAFQNPKDKRKNSLKTELQVIAQKKL